MAKAMTKLDTRLQMEASMMSMLVILLGLLVGAIFTVAFTNAGTFVKIMVGVNGVAGFVFLSSFLTTSFQQYTTYMEAMNFMEN
jgi:hypothetical protein